MADARRDYAHAHIQLTILAELLAVGRRRSTSRSSSWLLRQTRVVEAIAGRMLGRGDHQLASGARFGQLSGLPHGHAASPVSPSMRPLADFLSLSSLLPTDEELECRG